MSTFALIHTAEHKQIGMGINLNILNRHAKKAKGVSYIHVTKMQTVSEYLKDGSAGAAVRIIYANGDYGDIDFVDYSHACKWALGKRRRAGTYFSGCTVTGTP